METIIKEGLLSTPKFVPHWYLYDTYGSILFDKIAMENPYYHLYRTEKSILQQKADEIVSESDDVVLCELGAGSSTKTTLLLSALLKRNTTVTFIPIDQAKDFMENSVKTLVQRFNVGLEVKPFAGDYIDGLNYIKDINQNKLIIWLGSSISNMSMKNLKSILAHINTIMGENDRLLIGIDITQDKDKVVTMYKHFQTWAPFNFNVLTRLNREFGADFKHENFVMYTNYVASDDKNGIVENPQYVQHALESTCQHQVHVDDLDLMLNFEAGELFYCHELEHMSLKWNWKQFADTMKKGGFRIEKTWSDDGNRFGLARLRKNEYI
ncbi:histidine N-alpha-methyltransferase-like [Saccoglossus kowalevskii]|uniref:Meiotically up-regulated gene 158 protein-like n=1 Tax=Saccoglossus kowalevskii TaxID=10224 RepID=A0ABM0LXC4_SACKO|nr:PREDICTED: meiotically up-regulated gene 158 protein-like [Saccoglossus kowalevskii]